MDSAPSPTAAATAATAGDSQESTFPSYEDRRLEERSWSNSDKTKQTPEFRGIRWTLDGPLETAVSFAPDYEYDPAEVLEPYQLPGNGDAGPTRHPFSAASVTTRKISSVTIRIETLDDLEDTWVELHSEHLDPDNDPPYDPSEVLFGPLPDGHISGAYGDPDRHLLRCCGEDRSLAGASASVVVRGTGDGGFVTIHDFVSTVHPYLLSRRDDILVAITKDPLTPQDGPLPVKTKLLVSVRSLDVHIQREAEWMFWRNKAPSKRIVVPVSGNPHYKTGTGN